MNRAEALWSILGNFVAVIQAHRRCINKPAQRNALGIQQLVSKAL
jgi:hypothetical protein